ncbi:hypothetical protein J4E85_009853 [Alternaria conjuncta]|uniref:uncharacterized protein n=1 Tax=Alternaria conjuncta TaxID=181017 RepID=UPI00221FE9E4|nr:uncharacterized protein J4E85_009853 [Alternaria conjuncta]KAI4917761.1 hypothetical protein J4E85_009853 [Alternaria conjuncta]
MANLENHADLLQYVARSLEDEEEFHFLQFESLQRTNIVAQQIELFELKQQFQNAKSVSANDLKDLKDTLKDYERLIALEEHVVSPSLEAEVIAGGVVQRSPLGTLDKLKYVGTGRIAAMNAGHLFMRVLAYQSASGLEGPEGCRAANDAVRSAVVSRPTRFAGFAVLPMSLPEEAAAELNRSGTTLGFKGAMVWNHLKDGTYYDAARFDPVFVMVQKLNVPLYLHPATPTADIASKLFAGNYPVAVVGKLGVTS